MKKMQKGFTLIELLVVIAIIGLLATIALASLNSARAKSADASVRSNMANINAQGELYYDANASYGNITSCITGMFSDTSVKAMVTQATASAVTPGTATCAGDGTAASQKWAISVGVLKSAGGYWCVDSTGTRKAEAAASVAGGVCP